MNVWQARDRACRRTATIIRVNGKARQSTESLSKDGEELNRRKRWVSDLGCHDRPSRLESAMRSSRAMSVCNAAIPEVAAIQGNVLANWEHGSTTLVDGAS